MGSSPRSIGSQGEDYSASYLLKHGYSILARNFRTRYGELDIVARLGDTIVFFEVKSRRGLAKGKPYEAVTQRKQEHLMRAAEAYILQNGLKEYKLSLRVLSIEMNQAGEVVRIREFEGPY